MRSFISPSFCLLMKNYNKGKGKRLFVRAVTKRMKNWKKSIIMLAMSMGLVATSAFTAFAGITASSSDATVAEHAESSDMQDGNTSDVADATDTSNMNADSDTSEKADDDTDAGEVPSASANVSVSQNDSNAGSDVGSFETSDKVTGDVEVGDFDLPEEPEEPETPVEPEQPEEPETPVEPEEPETPVEPEQPEEPETPVEPEQPEEPEKPVQPEEPEIPVEPEQPETPEEPEKPEQPEEPAKPETPEQPEQPDKPEVPVTPATPSDAQRDDHDDDGPSGHYHGGHTTTVIRTVEPTPVEFEVEPQPVPDPVLTDLPKLPPVTETALPKTGDNSDILGAIFVISGILLIGVLLTGHKDVKRSKAQYITVQAEWRKKTYATSGLAMNHNTTVHQPMFDMRTLLMTSGFRSPGYVTRSYVNITSMDMRHERLKQRCLSQYSQSLRDQTSNILTTLCSAIRNTFLHPLEVLKKRKLE